MTLSYDTTDLQGKDVVLRIDLCVFNRRSVSSSLKKLTATTKEGSGGRGKLFLG